jgi:hypothetical protein
MVRPCFCSAKVDARKKNAMPHKLIEYEWAALRPLLPNKPLEFIDKVKMLRCSYAGMHEP